MKDDKNELTHIKKRLFYLILMIMTGIVIYFLVTDNYIPEYQGQTNVMNKDFL